jgi:hypothetical protein
MSTLVAQTISNGTVSTSSANVIQGSAKAWVNFNGTNGSIYASYNVSSVTRTAAGNYLINFTNALSDANYSAVASSQTTGTGASIFVFSSAFNTTSAPATTGYRLACWNTSNGNALDPVHVCTSVFR